MNKQIQDWPFGVNCYFTCPEGYKNSFVYKANGKFQNK